MNWQNRGIMQLCQSHCASQYDVKIDMDLVFKTLSFYAVCLDLCLMLYS